MEKEKPAGEKTLPNDRQDGVHNLFDSVFRTLVEYFPWLVIPLVNEAFGLHYSINEPLRVLKNEHMTWGGMLVTDLFFELRGRYFHLECQSTTDRRMIIRVMEYAAAIAIEHAAQEPDGSFRMKFPESCVIYLRSTKNTPDSLTMHVDFPNGESVSFDVPLLKVQEFTKEELFEKDLLMLLPYYLMRYEDACRAADQAEADTEAGSRMRAGGEADRKLEGFFREYEEILEKLAKVCEEKQEQYLFRTLADLIIETASYLAPKKEKERTRAMGGTVIKTSAQIIMEQGIIRGIGLGELKKLVDLVCRKIARGKTPEVIAEDLEEEPENITRIYWVAMKYAPDYDVERIVNELTDGEAVKV